MLIDSSFPDFKLTVICNLPLSLAGADKPDNAVFIFLTKMTTIACHNALKQGAICGATLGTEGDMVVYALVTQGGTGGGH